MERILEAYVGEYASGKSENAINRALDLKRAGREVKLVDLDTVEPFYTLRPVKKLLEERGIQVVAWNTDEVTGLGETGYPIKPQMRWALQDGGDVILDVGYGIHGAKILNLVYGFSEKLVKIYAVVSIARPMTATVEDIVAYINSIGRVDGLINNSHLGDETDGEIIQEGAYIITSAAKKLGVPVIATSVAKEFADQIGERDCMNNSIRIIERFMKNAYW